LSWDSGVSPPSDTHEVHARDRRKDPDVFSIVLPAIRELETERAVDVGSNIEYLDPLADLTGDAFMGEQTIDLSTADVW